jgi:hypothetical protein
VKTFRWGGMVVAVLATVTAAAAADKCQSTVHMKDVAGAMGPGVRIQPVFTDGRIKGWRVFGISTSAQLVAKSIDPNAMLTHVCGVAAPEILVKDGDICCGGDASKQFEVTFKSADKQTRVLIERIRP